MHAGQWSQNDTDAALQSGCLFSSILFRMPEGTLSPAYSYAAAPHSVHRFTFRAYRALPCLRAQEVEGGRGVAPRAGNWDLAPVTQNVEPRRRHHSRWNRPWGAADWLTTYGPAARCAGRPRLTCASASGFSLVEHGAVIVSSARPW